jgi:hypothetical protein
MLFSRAPTTRFLTLFAALVQSQDNWTPVTTSIPFPYANARISLDESASTASLSVLYVNRCGGWTDFASTTTVALSIDCQGYSELNVHAVNGGCPNGGCCHPPLTVATVTTTPITRWSFVCSQTPPPSTVTTVPTVDITNTLPLPTLQPEQQPPATPVGLRATHYANGECRVIIDTELKEEGFRDRFCSSKYMEPTEYPSTVVSTIGVACDGCEYVHGGDLRAKTYCYPSFHDSLTPISPTVTATTASTRWVYDCQVK